MAAVGKRLGSTVSSGTIGTPDVLYTTPASTWTVVSTIAICNRGASSQTYRVAVSTTTSFENDGYLVYGGSVASGDAVYLTNGFVTDDTNIYILCSSDSTDVSFSAFGIENT